MSCAKVHLFIDLPFTKHLFSELTTDWPFYLTNIFKEKSNVVWIDAQQPARDVVLIAKPKYNITTRPFLVQPFKAIKART